MLRLKGSRRSFPASFHFILLAHFLALFACGGGSGSFPSPATPSNPVPSVSSVSPDTVTVNDAGNMITVTGSGFVSTSAVTWNGSPRDTTFVSATQTKAVLSESDLMTAGTGQLAVSNPTPGGGTSTAAPITIVYPMPVIASLSPSQVVAGGSTFPLTVIGRGFVPACIARFNGSDRPTSFVNSSHLLVTIDVVPVRSG